MSQTLSQAQKDLIAAQNDLASRDPSLKFYNSDGTPVNGAAATNGPSLNDPLALGYASRPRLRVLLNTGATAANAAIPQCLAVRIESNNHYQADRFTASFVPVASGASGTLQWWSQQKIIPVDIQIGMLPLGAPPNSIPAWTSLITGVADKMTLEPGRNQVTIEGRDLTANFIDNLNSGEFVNQSSSQIVQSLAAQYGMTAKVTDTSGTAGRYWADGRTINKHHKDGKVTTEWDLIVSLAKKEGYDAFVKGSVLYFQPQASDASTPYTWLYRIDALGRHTGNVQNLKMDRVLTLSKGLHVKVKSWHAKQSRVFSKTSSTSASISSPNGLSSIAQEFLIQHPNLTEDEAQDYADKMATEISLHELLINASLPGDLILTPRTLVRLTGTGTAFDQLYYTQSVTREISTISGFMMHASCKNKAAVDEAEAQSENSGGVNSGPEN